MNKLPKIPALIPTASLLISFVTAAVVAYLLVAHFQHTILQAWTNSTVTSQVSADEVAVATNAPSESSGDFVCGCPFCCGAVD